MDVIWLNFIYKFLNVDNGYDISDYYDIMDEFGIMEEFDRFLNEVYKRGIKIVMDFVVNYIFDEYKWFLELRKLKDSFYRNFYFW